jgi:hypothetical protein
MKSFEKMADAECVQTPTLAYNAQCVTHAQPLVDCANERMAQVKAARVMNERAMASARAWQEIANQNAKKV